jgi:SOS-response transcriptional repressor LexA
MNEMSLSNNLQQLMRVHGNISASELAKLTDIPQPTIHHILTGATKNPRKKALEALSGFFSISVDQLIGKSALPQIFPETVKEDLQISSVPIIEWGMVRHWPPADARGLQLKEILLNNKVAEGSFALIVDDSSREPLFPKNALLVFDPGKSMKDRDFVIVHLGQDDTVLFNRLFMENNENYLKQELGDGNFKLVKLNRKTDRVVGVLTEVRIQY